jgi:predicted transcriptional regulator
MKVREVMTPNPVCCLPTDTVQKIAAILCEQDIGSIPVVEDQQSRRLIGMITDRDLRCSIIAQGLAEAICQRTRAAWLLRWSRALRSSSCAASNAL